MSFVPSIFAYSVLESFPADLWPNSLAWLGLTARARIRKGSLVMLGLFYICLEVNIFLRTVISFREKKVLSISSQSIRKLDTKGVWFQK